MGYQRPLLPLIPVLLITWTQGYTTASYSEKQPWEGKEGKVRNFYYGQQVNMQLKLLREPRILF